MRQQIYKMMFEFENNISLPISLACIDPEKIPELIEKHKTLYESVQRSKFKSFRVLTVMPTIQMTEENYIKEIHYCDIREVDMDMRLEEKSVVQTIKISPEEAAQYGILPSY
jgi:hypothetical protein